MQSAQTPESFILLTRDFWDDPPRARHQVAEALAKNYKVSFISANRPGLPRLVRSRVSQNIEVFTPFFPIDYRIRYRVPAVNRLFQSWLFPLLKAELADPHSIVITWDHTLTRVFDYYDKVIYYCNDYPIRYFYFKAIKDYLEECERTTAGRSLFCVGTADFLVKRLSRFNTKVMELRLGAPSFEGKLTFVRNGTIRIGLVGFLDERRISLDIITGLVSRPNVKLDVYGIVNKKLREILRQYDNINLRGVMKGKPLFEEIKHIDVGIAPYRIADVNPGGTPNKMWLYLAAGKPVVVSDLPSMRDWEFRDHFVYRAKDDADFVAKVFLAYESDSEELMKSRADFARENSWDLRVARLVERIRGETNGSPRAPGPGPTSAIVSGHRRSLIS